MEIIEQLREIAARSNQIRLLNVYQGVPISYPAAITAVTENTLRVQTGRYQLACLYLERETFIQSSHLPEILKAKVLELDLPAQEASLGSFELEQEQVGDRMVVRVQPKNPIESKIKTADPQALVRGELADISGDGMGIFIDRRAFLARRYRPGDLIEILLTLPVSPAYGGQSALDQSPHKDPISRFDRDNLRLYHVPGQGRQSAGPSSPSPRPAGPVDLVVRGQVVNVREEAAHNRFRLGVRFRPEEPPPPAISQFIALRQAEILRELRELSDMLVRGE